MPLPPGYQVKLGSSLDRALLLKFMQQTYQEMEPGGDFAHLVTTVEQYLSQETPLWWVNLLTPCQVSGSVFLEPVPQPIGCLWLGTAIDQLTGSRHAHVFLLYVAPDHRRQGIGTVLMHQAETWARDRGDGQIGLQVFQTNEAALSLYTGLGFQPRSLWMVKLL